LQEPKAPALEQWAVDPPTARLASSDPAWTWSAGWTDAKRDERAAAATMKAADTAGAEATLTFRGTGVSVAGRCSQEGGRADVYLDGQKLGEIDAYVVPRTHDNDYWHVTGLAPGAHTLRIVTRADKDERSAGTRIAIERAVVYGR
jgi:carbohydrate esterase-like protein